MIWIVLGTAAALYVLACLALWIGQERLIYVPGAPPKGEPKDHGLPGNALFLKTSDGVRLYAWLVPADRPRGAALVLHGNAGNVEDRAEYARAFRAMGLTTLMLDWRGYGASDGRPTEDGTYLDAEAGYDHLVRALGFEPAQVVVFGESLGGGPAIELARRHTTALLVVQDTFASIVDLGARQYPWLPVRWLARVRYDNVAKIGSVPVPVLILHSREDRLVPYEHAERLYAAALQPKKLVELAGDHDEAAFTARPEWVRVVEAIVDGALKSKGPAR